MAIRTGRGLFVVACLAAFVMSPWAVSGSEITFHTSPPTPDADDQYNFIGASRDGLNVNDSNGLDGPIDDDFTYVALDRPPQGQTFMTPPAAQVWRIQSVWIQMAGYTDNGASPEAGFNGTDVDLSVGGEIRVSLGTAGPLGAYHTLNTYVITGEEPNNPAPTGKIATTNGSGLWMRFDVDTGPAPGGFLPNTLHFLEVVSGGPANRQFEWLGTKSDVYPDGNAVNGLRTSQADLIGDRVFFIQMTLVPEPNSVAATLLGVLALVPMRRRAC